MNLLKIFKYFMMLKQQRGNQKYGFRKMGCELFNPDSN